jgi:hypothetical protein
MNRLRRLILGAIALWLLFGVGTCVVHKDWQQRADFGDMFGAVNALFSGLAFAVLIYTMWLQREELELQRQELQETRRELERSADAHEASQKAFEKQIGLLESAGQVSALLKAYDVWMEKEFRHGLAKVIRQLQNPSGGWNEEDRREAKELCGRLDKFAQLVFYVGQDKVLELWDDPLGKAWLVLEEIVESERRSSGWTTKWKGFENIGRKAFDKLVAEGRDPRPKRQQLPLTNPMSAA